MTAAERSRRVFIKTYGCQMNVYDSARIGETLAVHGWVAAAGTEDADLVLLNTCHIREKAAEKVYSELGRLRLERERRERQGGELWLGVVGCVAQAEGEAMAGRAPFLDLIVGPQAYHRLPELLARRDRARGVQVDTAFPADSKFDALPERAPGDGAVSAFLTVQEGCDKFCTFCVVPYTRGAEASRPVAAVLAEARRLVATGARELVLLGQNVNAYRAAGPDGRDWGLGRLLAALAEIPGLARLRYTTSHPCDVDDELVAAHRDLPILMPFLHLPVQSGSDAVLEAMNRRYTTDFYRRVVDRLRGARPDLVLSSDFIVGFPGESDSDFAATLALVRELGFAQSFSFKFSARPGTPAALLRKHVPEPVKAARLRELQALLDAQTTALAEATVGVRTTLLLERPGRHPGQMVGRTPWLQVAHLDGCTARAGDLVEVTITRALPHSLAARAATQPSEIAS